MRQRQRQGAEAAAAAGRELEQKVWHARERTERAMAERKDLEVRRLLRVDADVVPSVEGPAER